MALSLKERIAAENARLVKAEDVDTVHQVDLSLLWDACTTPEYDVLDDRTLEWAENCQVRPLTVNEWLMRSDDDGYNIVTLDDLRFGIVLRRSAYQGQSFGEPLTGN